MNLQPTLQDELIILRPLQDDDFDLLYEVAKDPLIWELHQFKNRYQISVFTELFADSIKSGGALVAIDRSNNEIIGSSRFKRIDKVDTAVEIGWSFLSRKYWGGRYNGSMKKLMIDHAFEYFSDVIFYVDKYNIRSQKAVTKIGGKRITESTLKHLIKVSDCDWTYRINISDWRNTDSDNSHKQ